MELVDKFDNKRRTLGKTTERYEKIDGEYRQSMHVWIINDKGEFLIQKRTENKKVFPGKWSITGGGVDAGETTVDTVIRECKEELGIDVDLDKLELVMTIKRSYDFVDIYLLHQSFGLDEVIMQEDEVADVKWLSREQIESMIDEGVFADSVVFYFEMMMKILGM